jgi:NAD(P)-dependent dehydrogenase (short-subunit alcohol dehydrogenase family)
VEHEDWRSDFPAPPRWARWGWPEISTNRASCAVPSRWVHLGCREMGSLLAIASGPIATPLLGDLSDEWRAEKQAELPLGHFITAEEVAPTELLLASSPRGNLFMGQTLGPNSGDVMP